jgi:MFS family permease
MGELTSSWLMTSLTTSAVMVALVQSAATLPVLMLGLPCGALADILNRKRLFIGTQLWAGFTALVLCLAVTLDALTPALLLGLTFASGIGIAMRWPTYASIVPEVVPRAELSQAQALNGIAMNGTRTVGPIIAGMLLASVGGAAVFALSAVLSVFGAALVTRWHYDQKVSALPGERFVPAMRVGLQYVAQSRPMRAVLLISAAFFLQSTALLALLPLVAKRLGGSAGMYTLMMSAMGLGAVLSAYWIPRLRARFHRNHVVRGGSILQALATLLVAWAPNPYLAFAAMVLAGASWLATVNTVTIAAQLALPNWVRARGMAIFQMCFMGATAVSAALWGYVAQVGGVPVSLTCAAVCGIAVLAMARRLLELSDDLDFTPGPPLAEPVANFAIEPDQGPVMVTVEYEIDPARLDDFKAVMAESRANRLQKGALSWGLFHDVADPSKYIECYVDSSWVDHLRRFERYTAADAELTARRYAFHKGAGPVKVSRYVGELMQKHPRR